jgi:hypothetical protein
MAESRSSSPISSSPEQINSRPIVRRLVPGLPARAVEKKIREADRLSGAGDRELAFYLAEFKARRIYKARCSRSFADYIRNRKMRGRGPAGDLARIGKRLLSARTGRVRAREASWTVASGGGRHRHGGDRCRVGRVLQEAPCRGGRAPSVAAPSSR